MAIFVSLIALAVSLAALMVARRSSEREKRLVLAQRRSDMIAAMRETHRTLEVQVMNLEGMVDMTKDAVQNTRLERLFEDAQETDKTLAEIRSRLESLMIPDKPPPAVFRDMDDITADVMTVRRELEHHAEEAGELRSRLAVRESHERAAHEGEHVQHED
jgi:hypothetical protein